MNVITPTYRPARFASVENAHSSEAALAASRLVTKDFFPSLLLFAIKTIPIIKKIIP